MTLRIALIGGGRMGQALISGWNKADLPYKFTLFEPVISDNLASSLAANGWDANPVTKDTAPFDLIVIAVKPQSFDRVAKTTIKEITTEETIIVSIMAGLSSNKINQATGLNKVFRAMPNTPGQIGEGITAFCSTPSCSDADNAIAKRLLWPLGSAIKIDNEGDMDAVTAVSGSGPAYVFLLAESMIAAGVSEGLSPDLAHELAIKTLVGSAQLLSKSGETPLDLRKAVTSPGGTTEAAVDVLLAGGGIIQLMKRAVNAAAQKSRLLGR